MAQRNPTQRNLTRRNEVEPRQRRSGVVGCVRAARALFVPVAKRLHDRLFRNHVIRCSSWVHARPQAARSDALVSEATTMEARELEFSKTLDLRAEVAYDIGEHQDALGEARREGRSFRA